VELDALDSELFMADSHDDTLSSVRTTGNPGSNFEAVGDGRMRAGERVVAGDGDVLRDSSIDALAVMDNGRSLAMEDFARLCYGSAKDGEDALPGSAVSMCASMAEGKGAVRTLPCIHQAQGFFR
jgi:hypothetical protein